MNCNVSQFFSLNFCIYKYLYSLFQLEFFTCQELYALVNFVNPAVLGTPSSFRHIYEEPIVASQQPNTPQTEKELGKVSFTH